MTSVHAPFIKAMQEWVWRRFPTRQLSATDLYYVMQWASSEIPVSVFIDSFEAYLKEHPHFFETDCRLSKFQFQARRVISACRQHQTEADQPMDKIQVTDPYATILEQLALCGRRTKNPLIRDSLRTLYQKMRESCRTARREYPEWDKKADDFYRLKAQALLDWEQEFNGFCQTCFMMLADVEQEKLLELSPSEKVHLMYLGMDGQAAWQARRLNEKTAVYLGVAELLEVIKK